MKLKISCRRKSHLLFRVNLWLINAAVWQLSFAVSSRIWLVVKHKLSRNFLWCSRFYGKDCKFSGKTLCTCIQIAAVLRLALEHLIYSIFTTRVHFMLCNAEDPLHGFQNYCYLVQCHTIIIIVRVRRKWKDKVALRASCYLRLLARRSEELAWN